MGGLVPGGASHLQLSNDQFIPLFYFHCRKGMFQTFARRATTFILVLFSETRQNPFARKRTFTHNEHGMLQGIKPSEHICEESVAC